MLSARFEVGFYLLLAPAGADKRSPKAPFPLVENAGIQLAIRKRVPPEIRQEPGLTESTEDTKTVTTPSQNTLTLTPNRGLSP